MDDSQTLTSHQTRQMDASHSLSSLRSDKRKSKYKPLKKDSKPLGDKFSSLYATAVIEQKEEGDPVPPTPRQTEPDEAKPTAPTTARLTEVKQEPSIAPDRLVESTKLGEHNYETLGFPDQSHVDPSRTNVFDHFQAKHQANMAAGLPASLPLLAPKKQRTYQPIAPRNKESYLQRMGLVQYPGDPAPTSTPRKPRTYTPIRPDSQRYTQRLASGSSPALSSTHQLRRDPDTNPNHGASTTPANPKTPSIHRTPSGRESAHLSNNNINNNSNNGTSKNTPAHSGSKKSFVVKSASSKGSIRSKPGPISEKDKAELQLPVGEVDYDAVYKKYNMLYAQIEIEEMQKLGYLREYLQPQFWENPEEQQKLMRQSGDLRIPEDSQDLAESKFVNSGKFKVLAKQARPEAPSPKSNSIRSQQNLVEGTEQQRLNSQQSQQNIEEDYYGAASSRSLMNGSGPIKRPPAASHFPVLDNRSFFEKCSVGSKGRQTHPREQAKEG